MPTRFQAEPNEESASTNAVLAEVEAPPAQRSHGVVVSVLGVSAIIAVAQVVGLIAGEESPAVMGALPSAQIPLVGEGLRFEYQEGKGNPVPDPIPAPAPDRIVAEAPDGSRANVATGGEQSPFNITDDSSSPSTESPLPDTSAPDAPSGQRAPEPTERGDEEPGPSGSPIVESAPEAVEPSIASLDSNEEVAHSTTVAGTADGEESADYWLLVFVPGAGRYYPGPARLSVSENEWSQSIYIGGAEDVANTEYEVLLVTLDRSLGDILAAYRANEAASGQAVGLTDAELSGMTIEDAVTVRREGDGA